MSLSTGASLVLAISSLAHAADWPMFRGPNASGVSEAKNLPVEFGPDKNLIWKTDLPPGHSSPVISANRIFLTAVDAEKLFVFCLERESGKILWRREVPRPRKQELHKSNSAASPSIATDGRNVFAFFTDFGLVSYGPDGEERWRMPLGPLQQPVRDGRLSGAGQRQSDPGLRLGDWILRHRCRPEEREAGLAEGAARNDAWIFDSCVAARRRSDASNGGGNRPADRLRR